mmetsp:Transcript_40070/g.120791  ORF Transcript_40070/g.120791 Transcript_40070/m.120791 type:complete len:242 (+) Transcript_40070:911-1636(+)
MVTLLIQDLATASSPRQSSSTAAPLLIVRSMSTRLAADLLRRQVYPMRGLSGRFSMTSLGALVTRSMLLLKVLFSQGVPAAGERRVTLSDLLWMMKKLSTHSTLPSRVPSTFTVGELSTVPWLSMAHAVVPRSSLAFLTSTQSDPSSSGALVVTESRWRLSLMTSCAREERVVVGRALASSPGPRKSALRLGRMVRLWGAYPWREQQRRQGPSVKKTSALLQRLPKTMGLSDSLRMLLTSL